jgi:hypothetical protein
MDDSSRRSVAAQSSAPPARDCAAHAGFRAPSQRAAAKCYPQRCDQWTRPHRLDVFPSPPRARANRRKFLRCGDRLTGVGGRIKDSGPLSGPRSCLNASIDTKLMSPEKRPPGRHVGSGSPTRFPHTPDQPPVPDEEQKWQRSPATTCPDVASRSRPAAVT